MVTNYLNKFKLRKLPRGGGNMRNWTHQSVHLSCEMPRPKSSSVCLLSLVTTIWRVWVVCTICVHRDSPFSFRSTGGLSSYQFFFRCVRANGTACVSAWESVIRIVSNVHVDWGGDGGERSSIRVRRWRFVGFFFVTKAEKTVKLKRDEWIGRTKLNSERATEREKKRHCERTSGEKRLPDTRQRHATCTWRVRERDTRSVIVFIARACENSRGLHRAGLNSDFFRRHICTAVTCNLLFSLRPRVVAEIAAGYILRRSCA